MGAVTVFCRFHSILENHKWLYDSSVGGAEGALGVFQHGNTISIDIRLSDEECWRGYRHSTRKEIQRARRAGLRTEVDAGWRHMRDFLKVYNHTMDRNGAAQSYYFTNRSLEDFRSSLGQYGSLHVTFLGDAIVAASILSACDGIVQGLYQGCYQEAQKLGGQKLHYDDLRRWAQAQGNQVFHFGGGRGGHEQDPLFIVKSGFSDRRHPFFTGRWILNQPLYEQLTEQFIRRSALQGAEPAGDGYFPAYRTPTREVAVEAS
jgi:lipid II:glycine glycyltransferase (peptidoglycan interpeptide bridge formation enzyme)